jgi:4'-phosphopantetheinyl transferase
LQFAGKRDRKRAALAALGFAELQCNAHEIELWRTNLRAGAARIARLAKLLSPDELQRAARLRSPDDRRRFTVARGMLRLLLGQYLNAPPTSLRFCYGRHGKPALKAHRQLHFNLAHSGERAVYALSAVRPVGIDIEYIARNIEFERVARRFFTATEFAALIKTPAARRRRAFYRLWTAKEAVIKATGKGLAQALDGFEIDFASDRGKSLLTTNGGAEFQMSIYALSAGRDYIAAVAAPLDKHLFGNRSTGVKHADR